MFEVARLYKTLIKGGTVNCKKGVLTNCHLREAKDLVLGTEVIFPTQQDQKYLILVKKV